MKFIKAGKHKIKCQRKDGVEKWYKSTSEAIKDAKKNFSEGDAVKATFNDDYEIEKLVKTSYKSGKGSSGSGHFVASDERSVLASVCQLLSGTEGVTVKNVEKKLEDVFELGVKLVKGKVKDTKDEEDEEEEEEEEEE